MSIIMRSVNYIFLSISIIILIIFSTQSHLVSYRFMYISITLIPLLIPISSIPPVIESNENQDSFLTRILIVTMITTIAFPCIRILTYFFGFNIGIMGSAISNHSFCRLVEILMALCCILQTLTNIYMYWQTQLKSFGIAAISNICIIIAYCVAYETYNSYIIIL